MSTGRLAILTGTPNPESKAWSAKKSFPTLRKANPPLTDGKPQDPCPTQNRIEV